MHTNYINDSNSNHINSNHNNDNHNSIFIYILVICINIILLFF